MIRLEDVHRSFGPNRVLRGLSLEVREGETLTIIGGSGTGKSVTLKIMVGLLKPDRGRVFVDNKEITGMDEDALAQVQRKFGFLFQGAALFDSLTVAENVLFGIRHLKPEELSRGDEIVSRCLGLVGLKSEVAGLKPAELSGGMKKRVGLARAIAHEPDYILYDEPTTGLDPIMSDVINELIVGIREKMKITSIAVTHDMKSAYKISNRIAMIYEGRLAAVGTPSEIQCSEDPVVQQFISGSAQGPIQMPVRSYT
ncbi:MAG: ATP-binding cassette domain-containing protein [Elusimicrobia bacterium]|jgi:phospholipid/cholesterol/gamma-HCH transport system ATP-binding protein|nr:ATP-binding cassette domain-containing protein [Elusimicrobiota bacterium]